MIRHTYEVRIINRKGEEVTIFGPSKELWAARSIAKKQSPRRKVHIYRNNRRLPGGPTGLDQQAYALWWQEREDEPR